MSVFPEEGDIPALSLLQITNKCARGSLTRLPLLFSYGNSCNKRLFFILLPNVSNHLSLENMSVISYIIHKLGWQRIYYYPQMTVYSYGVDKECHDD
jgi:hypothetical protein